MPIDVSQLPAMLQLHRVAEHVYEGKPEHEGAEDLARNVVFGGQVLAQMIMAAHLDRNEDRDDDKECKSIHAIFARAGDYTQPIAYRVERMHDGRTLGSDTVTFSQNGKVMSRALILWSKDEPDLIRHTSLVEMPPVPPPDDPGNRADPRVFPGGAGLVVGGVDTRNDPDTVRPPVQNVWTKYVANHSSVANQAILSWATDGYLIGTSMLPHAGYSEGQAHKTISTGVVAHTLSFHDRFRADEWLLLANECIWAGRGRVHGRCNIWSEDARLVATYTQDSIVRGWDDARDRTADYKRVM